MAIDVMDAPGFCNSNVIIQLSFKKKEIEIHERHNSLLYDVLRSTYARELAGSNKLKLFWHDGDHANPWCGLNSRGDLIMVIRFHKKRAMELGLPLDPIRLRVMISVKKKRFLSCFGKRNKESSPNIPVDDMRGSSENHEEQNAPEDKKEGQEEQLQEAGDGNEEKKRAGGMRGERYIRPSLYRHSPNHSRVDISSTRHRESRYDSFQPRSNLDSRDDFYRTPTSRGHSRDDVYSSRRGTRRRDVVRTFMEETTFRSSDFMKRPTVIEHLGEHTYDNLPLLEHRHHEDLSEPPPTTRPLIKHIPIHVQVHPEPPFRAMQRDLPLPSENKQSPRFVEDYVEELTYAGMPFDPESLAVREERTETRRGENEHNWDNPFRRMSLPSEEEDWDHRPPLASRASADHSGGNVARRHSTHHDDDGETAREGTADRARAHEGNASDDVIPSGGQPALGHALIRHLRWPEGAPLVCVLFTSSALIFAFLVRVCLSSAARQ